MSGARSIDKGMRKRMMHRNRRNPVRPAFGGCASEVQRVGSGEEEGNVQIPMCHLA